MVRHRNAKKSASAAYLTILMSTDNRTMRPPRVLSVTETGPNAIRSEEGSAACCQLQTATDVLVQFIKVQLHMKELLKTQVQVYGLQERSIRPEVPAVKNRRKYPMHSSRPPFIF